MYESLSIRRNWRGAGAAYALFLGAFGCGPSFQTLHDNEARFEQCYSLEENARVDVQKKAHCWSDWGKRYAVGQTRDRIQYARIRSDALNRVSDTPTDEAMMAAAPGDMSQAPHGATAPMPTTMTAPPPRTMVAPYGAAAAKTNGPPL